MFKLSTKLAKLKRGWRWSQDITAWLVASSACYPQPARCFTFICFTLLCVHNLYLSKTAFKNLNRCPACVPICCVSVVVLHVCSKCVCFCGCAHALISYILKETETVSCVCVCVCVAEAEIYPVTGLSMLGGATWLKLSGHLHIMYLLWMFHVLT